MDKIIVFLKRHWAILIGILIGSLAGFLYWHLVGCNDGSCLLKSSPLFTTLFGAVLGGLIFSLFKKR